jgi:hypothetical protein
VSLEGLRLSRKYAWIVVSLETTGECHGVAVDLEALTCATVAELLREPDSDILDVDVGNVLDGTRKGWIHVETKRCVYWNEHFVDQGRSLYNDHTSHLSSVASQTLSCTHHLPRPFDVHAVRTGTVFASDFANDGAHAQ